MPSETKVNSGPAISAEGQSKPPETFGRSTDSIDSQILQELRQQNTYLKAIMRSNAMIFMFMGLAWSGAFFWVLNLILSGI